MMSLTRRLLPVAAALLVGMSGIAHVSAQDDGSDGMYLTPEEVLQAQQALDGYAPVTARTAKTILELQKQQALQRHASSSAEAATVEQSSEGNGPTDTTANDGTTTQTFDGSELSPSDQRLLDRAHRRGITVLPVDQGGDAGTQHAAAEDQPLPPTGPATTAGVVILFVAAGWTLWKAKERKLWL